MKRFLSWFGPIRAAGGLAGVLVATFLAGAPAVAYAFQTHVHEHSAVQMPPNDTGNASAEAAEGEGETHAPKPINWTDFSNHEQPPLAFMVLNFVVLLGIYYKFGKGPISEGLKNRRATIAREIEEAQRMRKEAEARAVKYQEKLSHLEAELKETRETLKAAGEGERDRIVREAEEKAARMEKDAKFLVEQELKQLRTELTREAVETAVAAAEELLKKRITSADQERLAEDYLSQLASKRPAPRTGMSVPPGSMGPAGGE
jgi:F-type H+-transporting ATPase subunit b